MFHNKYSIEDNGIGILLGCLHLTKFSFPVGTFFTICSKQVFYRHGTFLKSHAQSICGYLHKNSIRLIPQHG